jgi:hypothetical protein
VKNDRFRAPVDEAYVEALGRAAYTFARLEWDAVWCAEKMQPGYINTIESKKKTAGTIAKDLLKLVKNHSSSAVKAAALAPAQEFDRLVQIRNAILHGKPGTVSNGDQRLFKAGQVLTIDMVNDASDDFVAAQIELSDVLHKILT